jgi:hypothetical protein
MWVTARTERAQGKLPIPCVLSVPCGSKLLTSGVSHAILDFVANLKTSHNTAVNSSYKDYFTSGNFAFSSVQIYL